MWFAFTSQTTYLEDGALMVHFLQIIKLKSISSIRKYFSHMVMSSLVSSDFQQDTS